MHSDAKGECVHRILELQQSDIQYNFVEALGDMIEICLIIVFVADSLESIFLF